MNDMTDQFRLVIQAAGLAPPTEIIDGVIHRFMLSLYARDPRLDLRASHR